MNALLVKQYLSLTKPRVISLLLFTTLMSAWIAQKGWPDGVVMWGLFIGGYMAAGAANSINMALERDIDYQMHRTAVRPIVTKQISPKNALIFAGCLGLSSFLILTFTANLLSAFFAWIGLCVYVWVYTVLLKRRTWQNIVIGGAAGAFPPLVGYTAITNYADSFAWCLFGIIFVWTPVHFWALALILKDDYRKAGIPMLPVVKGEANTRLQIFIYTLITVVFSLVPYFQKEVGILYLGTCILLNILLLWMALGLLYRPSVGKSRLLFKYSMLYLALLFLMIAIDRSQSV